MKSNEYTVVKCIYLDLLLIEKEGWQLKSEKNETFWVNKWLAQLRTPQTVKQYAYKICRFMNYLDSKDCSYELANERHLDAFFTQLRFGKGGGIFSIDNNKSSSYATTLGYYYVISGFYKYLKKKNKEIKKTLSKYKSDETYEFLYNIAWTKENMNLYIDRNIEYYKPKKEYIKWYSDEEINAILSNLRRKRDKAIFLLSLCGMRIDEILSLRLYDYFPQKGCVVPYRSKGKETGYTGRVVPINIDTIRMIEDYLNTERLYVELDYLNAAQIITGNLFIVLNKNYSYGKTLKYHSVLDILKRSAKNAGIDPDKIRTHSGRSTMVMKDIVIHVKHPELLSMEDIRIKFGWKNSESINPYLNRTNPEISKDTRHLLDEVRNEQIQEFNKDRS